MGASGYLGSHVAEQLLLAGHEVNALVRSGSDTDFLQSLLTDFVDTLSLSTIDFRDQAALQASFNSGSVVINCLADTRMHISDHERRKVEVTLAGQLFNAANAAGVSRFIQLSTVMVYGFDRPVHAIDESWPCKPKHSYSRIALEREKNLLRLHQQKNAIELVILRPSNTLGRRDSSAMPAIIDSLKKGKFAVIGGGQWRYSCMDARDVGRAMVHLLDVPVTQAETFLVKGYDTSWLDLKTAIDSQLANSSTLMNVPKALAIFLGAVLEILTPYGKIPALTRFTASVVSHHTVFDDSKIRSTGFRPQYDLLATLDDALPANLTVK